ncbi:MAG TPA: hypothetical protein VJ774_01130 [Actinomycetota bacterium]|nr:hypothetical protein [Actinomycetota bacterium]
MRFHLAIGLALATACSGATVEEGWFFPTWNAGGDAPTAIVQGVLVAEHRCLFVDADGLRTLVVWEAGLGFENGTIVDSTGHPIAMVGETIHGGGGYFGDRRHIENLAGEAIPERCVPAGNGDRFALIYEVEAGPFAGASFGTASYPFGDRWVTEIRFSVPEIGKRLLSTPAPRGIATSADCGCDTLAATRPRLLRRADAAGFWV